MKFKIVNLDKRYAGWHYFQYRLKFTRFGDEKFLDYKILRDWLWETFGPSFERDLAYKFIENELGIQRPAWAWHYDTTDNVPYIYVADQATLTHLQLKWSA